MNRYAVPILLATLVLVSGLVVSCSAALPTLPSGWEWYHNDQYHYSVGYPEDWVESPSYNIMSFYEAGSDWSDVAVSVGAGATNENDLEEYVAANKISSGEGANYLYEGHVVVNGRQGYEMIFTLPIGGKLMKCHSVAFLARGEGYAISCIALEDEYNQYMYTFDTAINSFVIR